MKSRSALFLICVTTAALAFGQSPAGRHGEGQADGKKSLGGSGPMIRCELPMETSQVAGLKIHGALYGRPEQPQESFLIFFQNKEMTEVVHTELKPYSVFERGPEKWVEIKFGRPVTVPTEFWVTLDFRAGRTKGVYVSYDTSTGGKFSRTGLPGLESKAVDFGGDWMIEPMFIEKPRP